MEFTKLYKRILAGTICISLLSGFTGKEEFVELQGMLNGRSSGSFSRSDSNIVTTLTRGTRGKIMETKKLRSGSFGIKIKVLNGRAQGEELWVYHKDGNSDLELYESVPSDWSRTSRARNVESAQAARLTKDKRAISESKPARSASKPQRENRNIRDNGLRDEEITKSAVRSINKWNEGQAKPNCVFCSSKSNSTAGMQNLLRPPVEDFGKESQCYGIVNRQGQPTAKGEILMSYMNTPDRRRAYLKDNALGAMCPKFNSLSDNQKLQAWAWMFTALGEEESQCDLNKIHPIWATKKVRVCNKGKTRCHIVRKKFKLNPRVGYGIWAFEKDDNLRLRTRGEDCRNIKTFEGQANCVTRIMHDNQLENGYNALSGPMYWGPLIRWDEQMIGHMQRLKLCF